ncbi:signal peptide peptidase SppA [Labilibaculum euxinus]|uniref:Signal peptide peptidase SppA n=1 Tax=Labilibaculum euxinus TaxID=2686357 RepID=A0A7M4D7U1_9BACT|nr:signal peptide peptidase SppA [Labilibaculum euxinus]MUP38720.1 signal peptide peptidase SppA [Labilibaculum euxinus]MVB07925.1 signal peptide peptidase SppA [Labilibaculum euxinus]
MKSFFKFTFASILGVIIGGFILLFLGIMIIAAIASSSDKPVDIKDKSILEIKLNKQLVDRGSDNPMSNFNFFTMSADANIGLNTVLENIEKAKTDEKIKGIYLNVTDIPANFGGMASIEEIRNKLKEFKTTGKFIVSYNNFGHSQKAYYLTSIADSVFLNPEAGLFLLGMGGERTFYRKFLEKIGVEAQVIRVGKYKSATEQYFRDDMSDESREQTMAYVGAMWNQLLEGISEERNITVEKLNQLIDEVAVRKAADAEKYGLIDGVIYEDEMEDKLRKLSDIKENKKLRLVSTSDYANAPDANYKFSKNKIAVIYASGAIGLKQNESSIGPGLAKTIREARLDSTIKAIVLRVNSPGGYANVSDFIWREVKLASDAKPVIASMGNVAASGGYYIACTADTIVADKNTITGSIGIYGLFFSGEELIKEKFGLTTDSYGTNEHAAFGGSYPLMLPISSRKFTPTEKEIVQSIINNGYDIFVSRVAEGRNMTVEQVHEVAQGRVWNAMDAQKNGLVDVLGGLETAIQIAKEKAGVEDYRIVSLPKLKDPFEAIIEELTGKAKIKILKNELGSFYNTYEKTQDLIQLGGIQARIPYEIDLH